VLNYLWAGMILVGIVYAILTGNVAAITDAALDSAGEGISLCITMAGVMGLWMGLMEIAQESGMVEKMTNGIKPFLRLLFPRIPEGHNSLKYIATNMIANVLGLGWACMPAGLKAMEELANLEKERGNPEYCEESSGLVRSASDEMCIFLIINISSLQLIPINIIAYRSQYGSVNPGAIVGPAILATIVSALVGVAFCLVKNVTTHRNC
jgi:spore maturation protein A